MRKFLLSMVLVLTIGLSAMVWRIDDFETGDFTDLTNSDLDADGSFWSVVPTAKKGGAFMARSESIAKTPDNLLNYPSVYVEVDAFVSFWVAAEDSAKYSETYQLLIDFANPCQPGVSEVIWEETLTSSDWKEVVIDLKPFILANNPGAYDAYIYLGIRHNGSADQSALLVDDVMIKTYPVYLYDEGLFSIPESVVEPYSNVSFQFYVYDTTAYDYLNDWSWIGFDQVELHYVLTDASGAHPEEFISLTEIPCSDPRYPDTYVYIGDLTGHPMGTKMDFWVETTDLSGYNLVGKSQVFTMEWGEVNFEEGFEGGVMPDGWTTFQIGDAWSTQDKAWTVDVANQNVHGGLYSATSASQNNFGVWVTEDYLVTPLRRINGAPTLKYYINAQTIEGLTEKWSVLISTATGDYIDVADFVEIANDSIVPGADDSVWYEKTIFMGDYSEQYVRIMWKHIYTPLDTKLDRFLNIDDISIAEMPKYIMGDNGNVALPNEDFEINLTATDYSGINNVTVYYTLEGQAETSIVMTDNGDDTFTAYIPGQPINSKCSWYAVVTDDSNYSNTTTTGTYYVIWFSEAWLEWGIDYSDWPEPMNNGNKAAMDWNFGTKENLYIDKIEVGLANNATDLIWKVVEFDETPTDVVIGDLQGTHTFLANGDVYDIEDGKNALVNGHIALEFEFSSYNEIMLDEGGDKTHAWQWNSVTQWTTNLWGAFYIRMYVAQTGIEGEFVSSTTELCQNYPNPFNPATSISFYNRIAGDVKLSVYNTKGEIVATLIDEKMNEGYRKVDFNASKLNSGVYYYTLRTPEKTLTKKMVLVK